jgi:ABC-type bacteriocin/lantibiotic exporter with double-glycine peptidase domain
MQTSTIFELLIRLWGHLPRRRKSQIYFFVLLASVASCFEVISIGLIVPFLAVLLDPIKVMTDPAIASVIHRLGLTEQSQFALAITAIFIAATILSGFLRVTLLWSQSRLAQALGADLSVNIYRNTLYQPYLVHTQRNSSEIISGIANKVNSIVGGILIPIFSMVSSILFVILILIGGVLMEPLIASAAFVSFALMYGIVAACAKKALLRNSLRASRESTAIIKALQEGLGGIRDVLLDGTQAVYCKSYRDAELRLRRSQANIAIIGGTPKFVIEALGMVLIAIFAYHLSLEKVGMTDYLPILGAFAFGAQRLLPTLQHTYQSLTSMRGGYWHLSDTLSLLDQPLPAAALQTHILPMEFKNEIVLNNISFRYSPDSPWIFKNFSLQIIRGNCLGIIGVTGSGKSTLVDIIMGLLNPTSGTLEIDGINIDDNNKRSWQLAVSHVPQTIYLSDSTVLENIAFGIPAHQIDHARVRWAARKANISDVVESWDLQYETPVGERGVRLSGGQRQRIGIARALYKRAHVIIFDEATSALDNETEAAIMETIHRLDGEKTIIIIAHRLSTLEKCGLIVDVSRAPFAPN